MAKLIDVKCPICGAELELPAYLDRVFCTHCGGELIVAKDDHYPNETNSTNTCPLCRGKGITACLGIENIKVAGWFRSYDLFAESCSGVGKCLVYCYPPKADNISNYCRDGKCAWCKGTGRIFFTKCRFCEGTGNCRFCYGSGKCKFCNGKGVIRCRACDGTGIKPY